MVATNKLRGIIAERGLTQEKVAKMINITPVSFYRKMKRGIFDSDEMYQMIQILDIEKPADIFFADDVASNATNAF